MPETPSKKFLRQLLTALLLLSVLAGYLYSLTTVKFDHYELFNVKKTISWAQTSNNLYRPHVHLTVDNIILSQEQWKDYVLSAKIINADDCGLIFSYLDKSNYSFFYFNQQHQQIRYGRTKDGKVQDVQIVKFDFPLTFRVELEQKGGQAKLSVNEKTVFEVTTPITKGQIGLMINSAVTPPTLFNQIQFRGKQQGGLEVVSEVTNQHPERAKYAGLSLLPFYIAFALLVVFFIKAPIETLPTFTASLKNQKFLPIFVHLFLAGCFFWPFIARREVAIFSYDNIGEILPLFYYSKHHFESILQGHAPWLWNPWILNGMPFYSNHWDMIYYPLNWPAFLVKDAMFLQALTLKFFVEVVLIGVFAYGFFRREIQNPRWALIASVAYQMCSMLIFTMSIFPATSLYFSMTLYLYLLWSTEERKPIVNFLLLSLAVVFILTSANVAFIFYACLSIGIISIYRFLTVKDTKYLFWLTACAWVTGILMCSVRIISCLAGVTASNRMLENFNTIHDRAYMGLRLFLPEIAGWMGPDALNVLMSPNLGLTFRNLDMPSNPQNNFFVYFGVIAALLVLVGFINPAKGKHLFWKIYAMIAIGIALLWQPLWGILGILSFPLNHYSYHTIFLPVGVCALIGFTAAAWEKGEYKEDFKRNLAIGIVLIVAYIFVFLTYLFPVLVTVTRMLFVFVIAAVIIYFAFRRVRESDARRFLEICFIIINTIALCALILLTVAFFLSPIPKKTIIGSGFVLPLLWAALGTTLFLNYFQRSVLFISALIVTAATMAAGVILGGWLDQFLTWEPGLRIYVMDVLSGFLRMVLILQIGIACFGAFEKKIFPTRLLVVILFCFVAADLIVFNARFNNITAPFYFKNAFYPKEFAYRDMNPNLRQKMDLVNYRVHHLDRQDFNANKNLVYNIPTYSGTVGYMTPRYSKLLTEFGYSKGIFMLYPEDATDNARFLNLSAVRYSFDKQGLLEERSGMLARLNVLYQSEVLDDAAVLTRLQDPSFDPQKTVLLSQPLKINLQSVEESARVVPISKSNPNQLEANIDLASAGILLFTDSYDPGWKALIDGVSVPIVRANYNFMACAIGPGQHHIRFVYDPPQYRRNLILSLLGGLIFVAAGVFAVWPRKQKT